MDRPDEASQKRVSRHLSALMLPSTRPHDGAAARGTASSTTSSTTSSPLSDSAAPARSWASIIAPRLDDSTEAIVHHCGEAESSTNNHQAAAGDGQQPEGGAAKDRGDTGTESEGAARPKRKYPKRKHRKGTHTIRKVAIALLLPDEALLTRLLLRAGGEGAASGGDGDPEERSRSGRSTRASRPTAWCGNRAARRCGKACRGT